MMLRVCAALGVLALAGAASGCADPWSKYEDSLYETLRVPGEESYASHAALLGEVVEYSEEHNRKPPPGVQAEYALYLARVGRTEEAKKLLRAEVATYPESARFVTALGRILEGQRAFQPREEP